MRSTRHLVTKFYCHYIFKTAAQVAKLEAQIAAGKATLEADVRAAGDAAEALRQEVVQLRGATRERLAASEERVIELQVRPRPLLRGVSG